jgi:hypothetical protein
MEKERKYSNSKFSVETITSALKEFRRLLRLGKVKESIISLRIEEGNESWRFDTMEDFFHKYQITQGEYSLTVSIGGNAFSLHFSGGPTRVSIEANDPDILDKIFKYFDNAATKPAPEPPKLSITNYSLSRRLPSCLVDVSLLSEIENSLLKQLGEILQLPEKSLLADYSISIIDSLGTHTLKTISDLGTSMFADNTTEIRCGVSLYSPTRLEFSFRFNSQRLYSELTVTISTHEPRAKVAAITDLITRTLHPHTTANYYFHPPDIIGYLVPTLVIVMIFTGLYLPFHLRIVLLGMVTLIVFYYLVARPLFPYSEFDSKLFRKKSRWINWFVGGTLGFLVFGTLFQFLRKLFLGY